MSIHKGHRQRLRQRFLENNLTGFADHEVLELLLFYCIPRKDTNPLAHQLMDRFGSFAKVLEAPVSELKKVEGIGENAATFLSLMRYVSGHYQQDRFPKNTIFYDSAQYGEYLKGFFNEQVEEAYLLCLDAKRMELSCKKVAEGNVNATQISVRKIVETALLEKATFVVLAHNHPSGYAIPSTEDVFTTKLLVDALSAVDVVLLDHVVVASGDYVSIENSAAPMPGESQKEHWDRALEACLKAISSLR